MHGKRLRVRPTGERPACPMPLAHGVGPRGVVSATPHTSSRERAAMEVVLPQHPVGQGSMMSSRLSVPGGRFLWIYDCGSNQAAALDREIDTIAKPAIGVAQRHAIRRRSGSQQLRPSRERDGADGQGTRQSIHHGERTGRFQTGVAASLSVAASRGLRLEVTGARAGPVHAGGNIPGRSENAPLNPTPPAHTHPHPTPGSRH